MKLTSILLRRNRLPNGHIFRGKDRLVKKVEPVHLRQLEQDFAVEEQNMFYLRHPYLSEVSLSYIFLRIQQANALLAIGLFFLASPLICTTTQQFLAQEKVVKVGVQTQIKTLYSWKEVLGMNND